MERFVGVSEETVMGRRGKDVLEREENNAVKRISGVRMAWNAAPITLSFLSGAGDAACHTRQASPFGRGAFGAGPPRGDALRYFSRRR